MLVEQIRTKMVTLGLDGMLKALDDQMRISSFRELSFEERLGNLLDHESSWREDKRLQRLLKTAKLREPACMEDINYDVSRGLDRSQISSLSSCEWIKKGQNLLITGPTGAGKTWMACAFGNQACRRGYKTRFYRIPLLMEEMSMSHHDGTFTKKLNQISRLDLLILDDFGLTQLDTQARRDLLEIAEARSGLRSTVITTQLPVEKWHDFLSAGNRTAADAILDRLVGNSHRLKINGDSMRVLKT